MSDDVFAGRLLPGEQVIWTGRPGQGLLLTPQYIFLIPFSLLWCGFAIFWEASAAGIVGGQAGVEGAPMLLFGGVFVCVGLYFVFGRFLADAWIRGGIRYALTDKRVLIHRGAPFYSFSAIALDRLPALQLKERMDRSGTIRFGERSSIFGRSNFGMWSPTMDPTPQFLAIPDARSVFDTIQRRAVGAG